jgi:hypothetical protein
METKEPEGQKPRRLREVSCGQERARGNPKSKIQNPKQIQKAEKPKNQKPQTLALF